MKYSVLGLGYAPSEYDVERTEWMKHGIVSSGKLFSSWAGSSRRVYMRFAPVTKWLGAFLRYMQQYLAAKTFRDDSKNAAEDTSFARYEGSRLGYHTCAYSFV